jgi:PBP1b-binding outer membrane lipoprotein LpoB
MKSSMLILFILVFLGGCENTKGQNRHDPNHHEKPAQNERDKPS